MIPAGLAPVPVTVGDRTVVAAELAGLDGTLTFDVTTRRARAEMSVSLTTADDGCPALDLRQPIDAAHLDGQRLDPAQLAHTDLGGGPGAAVRVLDVPFAAGTTHVLELEVHKAKIVAARRSTSISGLLAQQIEILVGEEDAYEREERQALTLLEEGFHLRGEIRVSRDEHYER